MSGGATIVRVNVEQDIARNTTRRSVPSRDRTGENLCMSRSHFNTMARSRGCEVDSAGTQENCNSNAGRLQACGPPLVLSPIERTKPRGFVGEADTWKIHVERTTTGTSHCSARHTLMPIRLAVARAARALGNLPGRMANLVLKTLWLLRRDRTRFRSHRDAGRLERSFFLRDDCRTKARFKCISRVLVIG
jgi:hypothetical protein